MTIVNEIALAPGDGWLGEVEAGQVLRVTAESVIDFVAYSRADNAEYFDTARTRIYNLNIYPAGGQRLFSKQNNPMMRILHDGFEGIGRNDLQSAHGRSEEHTSELQSIMLSPYAVFFFNKKRQ